MITIITGAAGFAGRALVHELSAADVLGPRNDGDLPSLVRTALEAAA